MRKGKASSRDVAAWVSKIASPNLLFPLFVIAALAVPSLFPGLPAGQASSVSASNQTELVTNGGFESGSTGWVLAWDFHADPGFPYPHWGARYAYLTNADGTPGNNLFGTLYQTVSIPPSATSATLTFWYNITTQETGSTPYDVLNVTIKDSAGQYLATVAVFSNKDSQPIGVYSRKFFDMTPYVSRFA